MFCHPRHLSRRDGTGRRGNRDQHNVVKTSWKRNLHLAHALIDVGVLRKSLELVRDQLKEADVALLDSHLGTDDVDLLLSHHGLGLDLLDELGIVLVFTFSPSKGTTYLLESLIGDRHGCECGYEIFLAIFLCNGA